MIHARGLAVTMISLAALGCTPEAPKDAAAEAVKTEPPASVAELFDRLSGDAPPAQGSRAAALVRAATAPVADSLQSESTPPVRAVSDPPAGSLERVQAETAAELGQVLAQVSDEVPQVWIGWYVDRSIDAFREAIDKNKPLVLVVSEDWCSYCQWLAYDALRCPAVDQYAGEAVFAFSSPSKEKGANAIADSLDIAAYPTITVLEPEARMLLERGRINGYFDASALGEHLDTIIHKTAPRKFEDVPVDVLSPAGGAAGPNAPPPDPMADAIKSLSTWNPAPARPGSIATAESGAASRGLKHAPPAPKCR
jgi:hypothetical protein